VNGLFIILLSLLYVFNDKQFSIKLFGIGTIPIVIFMGIVSFIDTATDRPKNPYGMDVYKTEIADLFPFYGWSNAFSDSLINFRDSHTEGYSYVSFLPFLVLIVISVFLLINRNFLFKRWKDLTFSLRSSIIAALLCLTVAMGVHLIITEGIILEILPQLKQFRGLGRFSWPFYYVIFLSSAIILWQFIGGLKGKFLKTTIPLIVIILWICETYSYQKEFRKSIDTYSSVDLLNSQKTIANTLNTSQYKDVKFQAILTLPPSTEGGEKINLNNDYHIKTRVLPYSYQTGLPTTTAIMSRVPISTTLGILKMSSSSFGQKTSEKESLFTEEPFLTVIHKNFLSEFSDILEYSEYIGKSEYLHYYSTPSERVKKRQCYEIAQNSIDLKDLRTYQNNDTLLYFDDFNTHNHEGIKKSGALFCENRRCEVLDLPISIDLNGEINLSFWQKIMDDKSSVPTFLFEVFDKENNKILSDEFRDWHMPRMEVYDDWVRFKRTYTLDLKAKRAKFMINGDYIYIDNFLVTSSNINTHFSFDDREAFADHLMVIECSQ